MTFAIKDILRIEIAPALGCTEPAAVAYGAAAAVSLLPERAMDSVEVWVDPNMFKNGVAVSIPGTEGLCGLDTAAVLGAMGGDAKLRLEVLEPINDETVNGTVEFVRQGKAKVSLVEDRKGLYIRTVITSGADAAESIIEGLHDNIVSLKLNGKEIADSPLLSAADSGEDTDLARLEKWLKSISLADLLGLVDQLDQEDVEFLKESITLNMRLAEYGLKHGSGLGIGKTLDRLTIQGLVKKDMILEARKLTSAAADARMAGVKMPAMSSAGSGNHGLTAVLPIWAIREFIDCEDKTVYEAICLSHLITAYVKAHTGRLTAVCGCSIAAGAGATAGATYLLGGDIHHIAGAISNLTEDLAGVICDGAKAGCALKLATAAGTAIQAALFSLQGVNVRATDGIIGSSVEQTTQNIGTLSTQGMIDVDRTILKIMLEKHFSEY